MRALFVLQSGQFLYGASRSIEGLLKNIDFEFDLMICKSFTKKVDKEAIRRRFGDNLKNIYVVWLPRYRCQFYDIHGIYSELSHYVNNIMAMLLGFARKSIIRKGKYDYIHLNSLVLYPMIDEYSKYIIHAREIINPSYQYKNLLVSKLKKAVGIIYIDDATKVSVEKEYCHPQTLLLNNPFDMTAVCDIDYMKTMKRYELSEDNTVFAMLGQIGRSKGSDIVFEAFHKVDNDDIRLLVLGNNDNPFAKQMMNKYKEDKRVIFCGELENTAPIYRICDYVFRGEEQFCIGRTIFEGLYAGCSVIIPGEEKDIERVPEGEKWKHQIYFYRPKDIKDLCRVIMQVMNNKMINRQYYSNVGEYVKEYTKYIGDILLLNI